MVALNTAYAAPKNAADPKNRVGDFFYEDHASVGKNRWANRLNTQEKSCYHYETASGRSNWPNRDPLGESGNDLLWRDSYMLSYSESILSIETANVFNAYRDLINYIIHFDYDYERYYDVLYDYESKAAFLNEVSSCSAYLREGSIDAELLVEGPNLYAFVGNDPISYYDSLGLSGQPSILNPNGVVPGGPWVPAGPGQQPGTFFGPKPSSGPRSICRFVPSEANGGPAGAQNSYWETQTPGQNVWQRYNMSGNPITPGQAHGGRGSSGGGSGIGGGGSRGGTMSPGRGGGRAPRGGGGGGGGANPHMPSWMP